MTFRKLVLKSGKWGWVYSGGHVVIKSPQNKKHVVQDHKLLGTTPDVVERAHWKRYLHITPKHVRTWIEANLL